LIPIFAVESDDTYELRRLPPASQMNMSEPLFFALAPMKEREVIQVAGSWDVRATRGDSNEQFFSWDLTAEGETVAGRFDQYTDYRFASLTGGTIRSNKIELRVAYLMDQYVLAGEEAEGKWSGPLASRRFFRTRHFGKQRGGQRQR
jgi:hypothetical protein